MFSDWRATRKGAQNKQRNNRQAMCHLSASAKKTIAHPTISSGNHNNDHTSQELLP